DEVALVIGAGIIGQGVVMAIRGLGIAAKILIIARHASQVETLKQSGADEVIVVSRGASRADLFGQVASHLNTERVPGKFGNQAMVGGADLVYDCVGTGESLANAMKFCKARGTVVAAGTSHIALVDTTALWFNELTILGAYGRQFEELDGVRRHTYEIVFEMMTNQRIDVSTLRVKTFRPSEYRQAFKSVGRRIREGVSKIAFQHDTT
ncbi:MAG: zinc-binding dehydrogenase, partial [Planctomycetes bacterium]|nr:zinc-binding dehydrogenase [Planctomycetota bacterium]